MVQRTLIFVSLVISFTLVATVALRRRGGERRDDAATYARVWDKHTPFLKSGTISVTCLTGNLRIVSDSDGDIWTHAERIADVDGGQASSGWVDQCDIRIQIAGDAISISEVQDDPVPHIVPAGMLHTMRTDIHVPRRFEMYFNSLKSPSHFIGSWNEQAFQRISASARNGGLAARMRAVPAGGMNLTIASGNIRVDLPTDINTHLRAECGTLGSSIESPVQNIPRTSITLPRIERNLGSGGAELDLRTKAGFILVKEEIIPKSDHFLVMPPF